MPIIVYPICLWLVAGSFALGRSLRNRKLLHYNGSSRVASLACIRQDTITRCMPNAQAQNLLESWLTARRTIRHMFRYNPATVQSISCYVNLEFVKIPLHSSNRSSKKTVGI